METVTRRRFTVDEYHCMGEAGVLHEDERVELVEGEILEMSPIGSRHAGCVLGLSDWFNARLSGRVFVNVQNPLRLSPRSEPQPDIALLRRRADRYTTSHPGPEDVLLLIEVSDTSLDYDRRTKLPLYAAAGIPEVWIVDLDHDRIEVYRRPVDGRYQQMTIVERGGVLSPIAFPELRIACDEILL